MTRREQLQEQYEDALFALMMDEVATAEGKNFLEENERLRNDPDAAVPEEVSRRCRKTIRRHFAKQRVATAGRFTVKALSRVALVAGICSILFTVAFAVSEPIRVNTINLVVEVFGESTDFYFAGSESSASSNLAAGWLPDGYILEDYGEKNTDRWCSYRKSEDEYIQIMYTSGNGAVIGVDTENTEAENIKVNGVQATFVKKGDELQIVWGVANYTAFIQIIGTGITSEELVRVAGEINY